MRTRQSIRCENLEYEIEALENELESLEYDFAVAETFGDRRSIYIEYTQKEKEKQGLINLCEW